LENIVSGVDTMYDLIKDVSVLRNKIEMVQPSLNKLEGKIDDIENKIVKLETNIGYLIRDKIQIIMDDMILNKIIIK
jgi:peptidoglycan hydrolase CwlO-like protein